MRVARGVGPPRQPTPAQLLVAGGEHRVDAHGQPALGLEGLEGLHVPGLRAGLVDGHVAALRHLLEAGQDALLELLLRGGRDRGGEEGHRAVQDDARGVPVGVLQDLAALGRLGVAR